MAFFDEFRHLKIQLEEIKLATDNFADNKFIGKGGFGKVYKGEISHSKGRTMVAFKRLDSRLGQGNSEFWKEVMMLSRHTHENLISLVGYCDEGDEKILAYEYASRGSLERYLGATNLRWTLRLKICVAAARGLSYLHDPKDAQQRVLHRDIKSANILLDENWNAKISDLGLSKIGPANQLHTLLVSNAVGTPGYCDPQYMEMGFLSKESDVYSLGVVLFEVLCGRLCFRYNNGQWEILVRTWKQSYEQKNMVEIIFQDLMKEMDSRSLKTFSDIAYRCLQSSREERPTMAHVVKELEIALELQEISQGVYQTKDYEEIIKTEVPSLIYRSKVELEMILSKGILVNGGKTWFSLNKKGEHVEMISAAELSITNEKSEFWSNENSRFPKGCYLGFSGRFNTHARTRFLSPGITYAINLVFKIISTHGSLGGLKYNLEGETKSSIAYLVEEREGGWMKAELYQFTSDKRTFDLKIQFHGGDHMHHVSLKVEGIEFRPVEKVEDEASEDDKINIQPISELDRDWEQILPSDYKEIIKWAKDSMKWRTKKQLYSLFCKGFLINDGEEYFSLAKNGKNRYMLSARAALVESEWIWKSLSESRFGEAAYIASNWRVRIVCKIKSQMLFPQTTYACYLIYKIIEDMAFNFKAPVRVRDEDFDLDDSHAAEFWVIYLLSPQTPVIRPKVDQNTHNPSDTPKRKGLPQLRNDGWMEVQVWEFRTTTTSETILMHFELESYGCNTFNGLIVQGIELKPL